MPVIEANDSNFKQLLSDNPNVVVKYYADWCGSCRLFAPKYKKIADQEPFSGITFLDVNSELNADARKAAGVDNLPFFAVFKNGELLDAKATSKEERLIEMIQKLT
jgi:thiol-disulfide isomerase/thioredoxin